MEGSGSDQATRSPAQASLSNPQPGTVCPANSYSTGGLGMGTAIPNSGVALSSTALQDKLNQVALYGIIVNPPSANGSQGAEEFFEDLDADGKGTVEWRSICSLLMPQDMHHQSRHAPNDEIDFDQFVEFVEAISAQRREVGAQ